MRLFHLVSLNSNVPIGRFGFIEKFSKGGCDGMDLMWWIWIMLWYIINIYNIKKSLTNHSWIGNFSIQTNISLSTTHKTHNQLPIYWHIVNLVCWKHLKSFNQKLRNLSTLGFFNFLNHERLIKFHLAISRHQLCRCDSTKSWHELLYATILVHCPSLLYSLATFIFISYEIMYATAWKRSQHYLDS